MKVGVQGLICDLTPPPPKNSKWQEDRITASSGHNVQKLPASW